MAEQSQIGELQPFESVNWAALMETCHPVDVVLKERMRVYYKLDANKVFVRATAWNGLISTVTMSSGLVSVARESGEILETGNCRISKFKHGGLKSRNSQQGMVGGSDIERDRSNSPEVSWIKVDFLSCILVDVNCWSRADHPTLPKNSAVSFENCATEVHITIKDLYVIREDVERLLGWGVDYPPSGDSRERPLAVIWLYRVSLAYNRGLILPLDGEQPDKMEVHYKAIVNWLENNAPEEVGKAGWKRTAKTIVSINYNRSSKFNEAGLARYFTKELIPKNHLSLPVQYVLVLTEWWINQAEKRRSLPELAYYLLEAGFGKIAVQDLVGMISGKLISRTGLVEFWKRVELVMKAHNRRERRKAYPSAEKLTKKMVVKNRQA